MSVIIPVYNRAKMVERAVASVLEQTYSEYELVVVDDGSTERLSALVELASRSGHRLERIGRSGVARARNVGVERSSGEWIAFLDSDDRWLPEKLALQLEYLEAHRGLRICQTEERWIRKGRFANAPQSHVKPEGDVFASSLKRCCISPSAVMLSRRLFLDSGGFDEHLSVCEDYDLWLRISLSEQVGLVKRVLVEKYGGHEDQLSRSRPAMDRFRIYAMLKLLLGGGLDEEKRRMVLDEIRHKAMVVAEGAKKRSMDERAFLYRRTAQGAASLLSRPTAEADGAEKLFLEELLSAHRKEILSESRRNEQGPSKGCF